MLPAFYLMKSSYIAFLIACLCLFNACKKQGTPKPNQAPNTQFSLEEINLSGEDRLKSNVRLSWFGTDVDGYVIGYELSQDNTTWEFTAAQDSIFRFTLNSGSDTADITLFVRAIDNDSLRDPEPAFLRIPIKNTAPEVAWDEDVQPIDSARIAFNFLWSASDLDGNSSITKAEIKINSSSWTEIDRFTNLLTVEASNPTQVGEQNALIFYDNETNPFAIPGLVVGDTNQFFIRVTDEAGAVSAVDTSVTFYLKPKTGNVLVVSGHNFGIDQFYNERLREAGVTFDVENYKQQGGKYIPTNWEQSFLRTAQYYDAIFMHTDNSLFSNPAGPEELHLAELAAVALSRYSNEGGKVFINANFSSVQVTTDFEAGFPVDNLNDTRGIARLFGDSAFVATQPGYLNLTPTGGNIISDVRTIEPSVAAEEIYFGQFDKRNNWEGPETVGIRANGPNGKTNFVFISMDLHLLDGQNNVNQVLDHIFNEEFNW